MSQTGLCFGTFGSVLSKSIASLASLQSQLLHVRQFSVKIHPRHYQSNEPVLRKMNLLSREAGKPTRKQTRRQRRIPGIVYGLDKDGKEEKILVGTPISELGKYAMALNLTNTVFEITIDGNAQSDWVIPRNPQITRRTFFFVFKFTKKRVFFYISPLYLFP